MNNQVRIIAGLWRGRKLRFADVPGLRPTPDRVRETLFNWLQVYVVGARCLDLFAGSGALGFEAASREAAQVLQVEHDPRACESLRKNIEKLGCGERVSWVKADVLKFLQGPSRIFDLVFLDPPFGQGLVTPVCQVLETNGWLAGGARIYIEAEAGLVLTELPANWQPLKIRKAGGVGYHLFVRQ